MSKFRNNLLVILIFAILLAPALSDLLISKLDRWVHYRFSNLSLLSEPLMLIFGLFSLFVACIIYMHHLYLTKLQWKQVLVTIQQLQYVISLCLSIHVRLEASLRELSRTGDVQACKAVLKSADRLLKDFFKECKPLLAFLQSSPQAAHILPMLEEFAVMERDLLEFVEDI